LDNLYSARIDKILQLVGYLLSCLITAAEDQSEHREKHYSIRRSYPWIENRRSLADAEAISDSVERSMEGRSLK
jgi:hypothetical protein